jgi:alginate O-acetyltransferase complex protein AlgI
MYVSLYPQLIAGPIVRYELINNQLDNRKITIEDVSSGITRFIIGLAKKVIIANQIGAAADNILERSADTLTVGSAWLGIFFFALQIYYDFSGYSDMSIGLGRIFGFTFPENFDYPYISKSITEFWRRWHMTLGGFFRDYVYIPLGGNRQSCLSWFRFNKSKVVTKHGVWINLMIVWFLTGLWHGASWNFALWGLYFGLLIIIEKAFLLKITKKIPAFIKIPITFLAVTFGWSMFYFTDFSQMMSFMKSLFGLNGNTDNTLYDLITINLLYEKIFLVIIAVICCTPIYKKAIALRWITPVSNAVLIILCAIMLVGENYNPFLYYRF